MTLPCQQIYQAEANMIKTTCMLYKGDKKGRKIEVFWSEKPRSNVLATKSDGERVCGHHMRGESDVGVSSGGTCSCHKIEGSSKFNVTMFSIAAASSEAKGANKINSNTLVDEKLYTLKKVVKDVAEVSTT